MMRRSTMDRYRRDYILSVERLKKKMKQRLEEYIRDGAACLPVYEDPALPRTEKERFSFRIKDGRLIPRY